MGQQIEPQAKQIILKVIQFCEEEKKNGLLAPRHLAIKRACLATGLSKYTILKIRNEELNAAAAGNIGGYTPYSEGQMFQEVDQILGSINEDLGPSNVNVHGLVPASSTMETVQIKMELEEAKQDSAQPTYMDNPSYSVSIKSEPVDEYDEDGVLTTTVVKCEFESSDDPLLPNRSVEDDELAEGADPEQLKQAAEIAVQQTHQLTDMATASGDKRYQCSVCQKCFTRPDSLTAHFRQHTGEKPYTCKVCQRQFSHRPNLHRHLRTHTGEKRFECSFCQSRFAQKGQLESHIIKHTGEKRYKCDICNKLFAYRNYLKTHLRTHTGEKPFECEVCHQRFSQSSGLRVHIAIHTGETRNKCEICQKQFTCKYYLKIHSRKHTGEKPFECNICGDRFSDKPKLQTHAKTHSGDAT